MENILLVLLAFGISTILFGIWGFAEAYTRNQNFVHIGFSSLLLCTVASWMLYLGYHAWILIAKFIVLLF
jgi:ABC-type multidrug transport system permease subunit